METPITSSVVEDPMPRTGALLGRYHLGEVIGTGELGNVYAIEDRMRLSIADGSLVAAKVFHRAFLESCGGSRRLATRLAATCRLGHPNVLNAHDFHHEEGLVFLIMERLTGESLADKLHRSSARPPVPLGETDAILRQLVEALAYIHATTGSPLLRLTPKKIRLPGAGRRLCLADLGLGPLIDPPLLRQMAMASGDSVYLAPEVIDGSATPDCRADQFSLGMIALALLTGTPRGSVDDLEAAWTGSATSPWRTVLPQLLAPDPAHRFADFSAVHAALVARPNPRSRWIEFRRRTVARLRPWSIPRRWGYAFLGMAGAGLVVAYGLAFHRTTHGWRDPFASQLEQTRRDLRALDTLRLELVATAAAYPELGEPWLEHLSAGSEIEIASSLGAATTALERGRSAEVSRRLTAARVALDERRRSLAAARDAVTACRQLDVLAISADEVKNLVTLPESMNASALRATRRDALRRLAAGDMEPAAAAAVSAAGLASTTLHQLADAVRQDAIAAQAEWQSTLRQMGSFPDLEPVTEPATRIREGESALAAGQQVAATRAFAAARDGYRSWTRGMAEPPRPIGDRPEQPPAPPPTPPAFTNSLGMRFVPVGDLLASIWETRLIDFMAFVEETGADAGRRWLEFAAATRQFAGTAVGQGPRHPVTHIGFTDSERFCQWLTRRERAAGLLRTDQEYRLPTDLEWSLLAGLVDDPNKPPQDRSLDHPGHYPWGTSASRTPNAGNYDTWPNRDAESAKVDHIQDPFPQTAPVGSFPSQAHGLHDLGGNVWEWTRTPLFEPPWLPNVKAIRGGGWRTMSLESMQTHFRDGNGLSTEEIGFRIVLAPVAAGEVDPAVDDRSTEERSTEERSAEERSAEERSAEERHPTQPDDVPK